MATLSFPQSRSHSPAFHSPLALSPTASRHQQQPHRGRHLLALIDRKGSPRVFPLSVARALAGSHFCPRRNFISLKRGRRKAPEVEEGEEVLRRKEMSRCLDRAAHDAGALVTIRTGGLTGDTYPRSRSAPKRYKVRERSFSFYSPFRERAGIRESSDLHRFDCAD